MIVWLDLETTGTDPKRDLILEIGVIGPTGQRGTWIIGHPRAVIESMCSDYVRKMHTDNGLIELCNESMESLRSAEMEVIRFLILPAQEDPVLAGFSIHFDRAFVDAQMPRLASYLSHRLLDVSSIRRFLEDHPQFGALAKEYNENHPRPHRALDDCAAAKETYRFYRDMIDPRET